MTDKGTILVTAVGGDIGRSVARILRQSGRFDRVLGCDASEDHAGRTVVDRCFLVPPAGESRYVEALSAIIRSERVDYVIPISEPEIDDLHSRSRDTVEDAVLVMAQGTAISIGLDKLATARFVSALGLPAPWTIPVGAGVPPAFPCVMKERRGWGSRGFTIIEDDESLRFHAARRPTAILQELLVPDTEEYTCGVFRSSSGEIRTIVFRRRLLGGLTGWGVVVVDKEIDAALEAIAKALQLRGSINVQLRRTVAGPTVFEINARFSSTVMFRELLGFRDVIWSIDDLEGRSPPAYTAPVGTKVYRVFTEVVVRPGESAVP